MFVGKALVRIEAQKCFAKEPLHGLSDEEESNQPERDGKEGHRPCAHAHGEIGPEGDKSQPGD